MPNPTCRLLSNGYKFDLSDDHCKLILKPCCTSADAYTIDLNNIDIKSIQHFRHQLNLIDSYQHIGCSQCNFLTDNALRKTWRDVSFDVVPDDAKLGDASYLELQLDKICNGGCIICGPQNSSFWQHEVGVQISSIRKRTSEIVESVLSIIDISKTRKILFLGGEPFLSTVDEILLSRIPDPTVVDIQYTVNGSIYPNQRRIDQWRGFKSVLINFSIDGIGPRFDYIRYPLKWQVVKTNMQRMLQEMPDLVHFKINHTINILNLYYHDEFEQWRQQEFQHDRHGREIPYTFNPAVGVLSPLTVTHRLYRLIADRYAADSKNLRTIKHQESRLDGVLKYLRGIDSRRGLDWKQVFPEIADCLA